MSSTTLVSVDDYLHTSYPDGDREYVDGEIVERGMPTFGHGKLQLRLGYIFLSRYPNLVVAGDVRLQVTPTRYRIPDVVVMTADVPDVLALTEIPLIVVEIVSPDDRVRELDRKINDYRGLGVPNIWIFDPELQRARVCVVDGIKDVTAGDLRTIGGEISIPLAEIFPTSSH